VNPGKNTGGLWMDFHIPGTPFAGEKKGEFTQMAQALPQVPARYTGSPQSVPRFFGGQLDCLLR